MANIRQSILIREDLGLSVGLLAAQVAHIHHEGVRQSYLFNKKAMEKGKEGKGGLVSFGVSLEEQEWLESPYVFVHRVPNLEWLRYYIDEGRKSDIWVNEWHDTIYLKASETQMKAFEDVLVGVALGPNDSDKIKAIIGDLPLL